MSTHADVGKVSERPIIAVLTNPLKIMCRCGGAVAARTAIAPGPKPTRKATVFNLTHQLLSTVWAVFIARIRVLHVFLGLEQLGKGDSAGIYPLGIGFVPGDLTHPNPLETDIIR